MERDRDQARACSRLLYLHGRRAPPLQLEGFELDVTAIDLTGSIAHGSLAVTMFVLPYTSEQGVQTDCGPGTTEDVGILF